MGQYYMVVNTTKKQVIEPDNICAGIKYSSMHTGIIPKMVMYLLCAYPARATGPLAGKWFNNQVAVAGDYGAIDLYREAHDYEDIGMKLLEEWAGLPDFKHDVREFLEGHEWLLTSEHRLRMEHTPRLLEMLKELRNAALQSEVVSHCRYRDSGRG